MAWIRSKSVAYECSTWILQWFAIKRVEGVNCGWSPFDALCTFHRRTLSGFFNDRRSIDEGRYITQDYEATQSVKCVSGSCDCVT